VRLPVSLQLATAAMVFALLVSIPLGVFAALRRNSWVDYLCTGYTVAGFAIPNFGLALIDAILARGDLQDYQFAHAARADCCRRLGRVDDARASYVRALELARQEPERRFLERRLNELL